MDIRFITRCEGMQCDACGRCLRHMAERHPAQGLADYSQAPEFKPTNPAESCRMFIALPVQNGETK